MPISRNPSKRKQQLLHGTASLRMSQRNTQQALHWHRLLITKITAVGPTKAATTKTKEIGSATRFSRPAPDEEKKNASKRAANFAADYSNRLAQVEFEVKNLHAAHLNVAPRREFASRWADPNHPVNQSRLVIMLSGGALSPGAGRPQKRDSRVSRRGRPSVLERREQLAGGPGGVMGAAKRKLQEDLLYLVIVNMPSEEELKAAAEITAKAKQGGFGAQLQHLMGGK